MGLRFSVVKTLSLPPGSTVKMQEHKLISVLDPSGKEVWQQKQADVTPRRNRAERARSWAPALSIATAILRVVSPVHGLATAHRAPAPLRPRDRAPRSRRGHAPPRRTMSWTHGRVSPTRAPGVDYRITFEVPAAAARTSIELTARDVEAEWTVLLGDTVLGTLPLREDERITFFDIPAGALVPGANVLHVHSLYPADDIVIGNVTLHPRSSHDVLDARYALGTVSIRVRDENGPLPARLSIVDAAGELTRLFETEFATRPGLMYTDGTDRRFALPAGRYRVHATRGMEWSRVGAELTIEARGEHQLELELHREVDTRGWVATDTHVHTVTHSYHGDATTNERMLSLAGEGVELAIATDHNHHTDYRAPQKNTAMTAWFTPVTGNEVSTPVGHFSAFPLDPDQTPPPYESHDWPTLVSGMRNAGARYVILNHPHWPEIHTGPFSTVGLDPTTASRLGDVPLTFDAVELINSTHTEPDPMLLLHDWFALLNRGERLFGVGSSDSHTLGDPVGQGRTYLRVPDDDPSTIDIEAALGAFTTGRMSISMGIFATLEVDGTGMGAELKTRAKRVRSRVRVATPSWIHARRLLLVIDGQIVDTVELSDVDGPRDEVLERTLELPDYDSWITAVVLGDGVSAPGWKTEAAYTIAITNPIFVDHDRRPGWSSPRETAERRLDAAGRDLRSIANAIERADEVIGPLMHEAMRAHIESMKPGYDPSHSRAPAHAH